jgi:pimeloyl-ACP methyl ester carboxylesterase
MPKRAKAGWRMWVAVAVAVLVLVPLVRIGLAAYRFEREVVFASRRLRDASPAASGLDGAVDVEIGRLGDQPQRGWYLGPANGAAVLFVHGTGTDRRGLADEARLLHAAGFGVLLVDLPGQGASGGAITWGEGERLTIRRSVDWLARQPGVEPGRIGAFAFSLGCQLLAPEVAADARIRAVAFAGLSTSVIGRMQRTHQRWGWLAVLPATLAFVQVGTNPWTMDVRDEMSAIAPRGILLVSGEQDSIATPEMSKDALAHAGPNARLETFDCGHGAYFVADPRRYEAVLVGFFKEFLCR